jgi:hypothetical protein
VRDAVTRHHTDEKPADKVDRLGDLAETYYFGHVKPSEREIRDAEERANNHSVEAARAKVMGTDFPTNQSSPASTARGAPMPATTQPASPWRWCPRRPGKWVGAGGYATSAVATHTNDATISRGRVSHPRRANLAKTANKTAVREPDARCLP